MYKGITIGFTADFSSEARWSEGSGLTQLTCGKKKKTLTKISLAKLFFKNEGKNRHSHIEKAKDLLILDLP